MRALKLRGGRRWTLVAAVFATLAVLASGGAWAYDLVDEAHAPKDVCHGLLNIDDVRGERGDPELDEVRYRDPGPRQPEMECAAGTWSVRSYPLPKAQSLIERSTMFLDAGYRPLGPGLEGVTSADQSWLLMPCPDVLGATPLFVGVDHDATSSGLHGDDARRKLAAATVRAARHVGERAGCGGPPLPDPQVAAEPAPDNLTAFERDGSVLRPLTGEPLCGLVPTSFFTADELRGVKTQATTPRGGTVDVCAAYEDDAQPSMQFAVVRGPAALYADDSAISLTGTCGASPALFRLTDFGALYDARGKTVLREFATRYAEQQNCTVDQS